MIFIKILIFNFWKLNFKLSIGLFSVYDGDMMVMVMVR